MRLEQNRFTVPDNSQQAEILINQYLKKGWEIQEFDPVKSDILFGIVAPSGSLFRLEGIFLDDGSEDVDFVQKTKERQLEINQAEHILELMRKTPKYLGM